VLYNLVLSKRIKRRLELGSSFKGSVVAIPAGLNRLNKLLNSEAFLRRYVLIDLILLK